MDDILNRIRVSREKEILADHEKTLNKALDYLASIESTDEKKITELIKSYNNLYYIKKFSKFEKVQLRFSSARNYYNGKILLFGDSLHQIHPLAGQG